MYSAKRCTPLAPHLLKPWFIDRKRIAVPGINAGLVNIDDHNLDVWALVCNHCHCGTAHIPGADAADGGDLGHCDCWVVMGLRNRLNVSMIRDSLFYKRWAVADFLLRVSSG